MRRRLWWRVLGGLICLYLLSIIVLICGESWVAFPGWKFPSPWTGMPAHTTVEEVAVPMDAGAHVQGWWLPSSDWMPDKGTVLYLHGNGENLPACGRTLVKWRNELQTGVFAVDYPGYGHSPGRPTEQNCCAAAQAAFDWLVREKKVAPRQIIIVGQSMGAAIATDLASHRPGRMLITSGAFTSAPDLAQQRFFWFPARSLVSLQFDNLGKMATLRMPVFIAHGTDDHTVPFAHGERLAAAVTQSPSRFFPLPGHGHSHPKAEEFYDAVRQFLRETEPATAVVR